MPSSTMNFSREIAPHDDETQDAEDGDEWKVGREQSWKTVYVCDVFGRS